MSPDNAKLLIAQVLSVSKDGIRGTLEALDSHPLGRIAMEMLRAKVRGELLTQEDILAAVHQATRPK